MSFPIEFQGPQLQKDAGLSFSYSFDPISEIYLADVSKFKTLPVNVPACQFSLPSKTSNPNMSLTKNGTTTAFGINSVYITGSIPHRNSFDKTANSTTYSFVIEGYSTADVDYNKLLVFIPLTLDDNAIINAFNDFDNNIKTDKITPTDKNANLKLGTFIPNDVYYYYTYKSNSNVVYNVIFFESSQITYKSTSNLSSIIQFNQALFAANNTISDSTLTLYSSTGMPNNKDSIQDLYDESIFIDCQPVEVIDHQPKAFYTQLNAGKISKTMDMVLTIGLYIILIGFIVYTLIYLSKWIEKYRAGGIRVSPVPVSVRQGV